MEQNILRGGQFLVKETKCEDVFTPEDFSEEQQMMKEAVKEFNDREIIPFKNRFEAKDYKFTEEVMRKAGELGFLSVSVPQEYEGLGMGFVSTILTCEYISSGTGSFSTAFGAHTGIGTMPIVLYGTEEQRQKYVPKLASGEWFASYCLTEPTAGSDANSGKTSAELSADGKSYKINGQKMWISNAGFCRLMIVFARIENDKNITGFIVEYDKENPNGITLGEEERKLGIRASSTRQVFFNDTIVPVENMLANRGEGFKIAINTLNIGRIKLATACIDSQRRIVTQCIDYAINRKQFNTPISEFGAIKIKLAESATNTYAGESACYRAAKDIENRIALRKEAGNPPQEAELKSVEEYAIECSILKVAISDDLQICADEGIQIYGGMGFSEEVPMESSWRDSRISRIYEGTNEINKILAVGMLVKKAMKGHLDLMSAAKEVQDDLMGIPSFESPNFDELFSEERMIIKNLKKVFLMVAGAATEKYGTELENHQQLLIASADILIEIYMSESTILRTEKNAKRFGEEAQSTQIAMSKLYLFHSAQTIEQKAKECIISFANGDEQRMMLMGLKRFTKYNNYPNVIDLRIRIVEKLKAEKGYCF